MTTLLRLELDRLLKDMTFKLEHGYGDVPRVELAEWITRLKAIREAFQ